MPFKWTKFLNSSSGHSPNVPDRDDEIIPDELLEIGGGRWIHGQGGCAIGLQQGDQEQHEHCLANHSGRCCAIGELVKVQEYIFSYSINIHRSGPLGMEMNGTSSRSRQRDRHKDKKAFRV